MVILKTIASRFVDCSRKGDLTQRQRAIMYTIDGLLMSLVLLTGLVVAYQIAPSQAALEEDIDEQRLQTEFESLYDIAAAENNLKNATLYWDDSAGEWVGSNYDSHYTTPPPGHPLSSILSELEERGYAYSLQIEYLNSKGVSEQHTYFEQGTPTSDAIVLSETVGIQNNDSFVGPSSDTTPHESSTYFAPDAFKNSQRYNIFQIRLIVWRP